MTTTRRTRHRDRTVAFALLGAIASCAHDGATHDETLVASRLVTATSATTSRPRSPEPADAEPADTEPDPFPVLHTERLGPFSIGLAKEATLKLAPALRQVGPVIEEGASGDYVETWEDASMGLSVAFSSSAEDAPKRLRSVMIGAPSTLRTSRGVAVGAAYAGVLAEYGDVIDRDFPPTDKTIIAGSLYGGLIFHFEGGLVKEIFLGAGAE